MEASFRRSIGSQLGVQAKDASATYLHVWNLDDTYPQYLEADVSYVFGCADDCSWWIGH